MTEPALSIIPIGEYYYLETFCPSELRHEYVDGAMLAMGGGSVLHSELASRVIAQLSRQLDPRQCVVHGSDLRVRVSSQARVFRPDVTIICGKPVLDAADKNGESVTNPRVIVEVLSPSTERYDRETKLPSYQTIETLRAVVFIHQERPLVETWFRQNPHDSWLHERFEGNRYFTLPSPAISIFISPLYVRAE